MDEELDAACRRFLIDGLPATVPMELASKDDFIPLSVDTDSDVAVVAVLRWWQGFSARPASALMIPRPMIDVRGFRLVDGNWENVGGSVGSIVDHYPLTIRPRAADLGAHLQWQGGGRIDTGVTSTDESLYINDARLRVAAQVTQLRVGSRRLMIPPHGYVAVGWPSLNSAPSIAAITDDGSEVASLNLAQEPGAHRRPVDPH